MDTVDNIKHISGNNRDIRLNIIHGKEDSILPERHAKAIDRSIITMQDREPRAKHQSISVAGLDHVLGGEKYPGSYTDQTQFLAPIIDKAARGQYVDGQAFTRPAIIEQQPKILATTLNAVDAFKDQTLGDLGDISDLDIGSPFKNMSPKTPTRSASSNLSAPETETLLKKDHPNKINLNEVVNTPNPYDIFSGEEKSHSSSVEPSELSKLKPTSTPQNQTPTKTESKER